MRVDGWKIALTCGLILCALIILIGIVLLFTPGVAFAVRLALSILCIMAGVALGAIGIELWRDT